MTSLLISLIVIGVFLTGVPIIYVIREAITESPFDILFMLLKPSRVFTLVIDYIAEEYSDSKAVRNAILAGLGLIIIPTVLLVAVPYVTKPSSTPHQSTSENSDLKVEAE
jgi:uncharacterized membrane protein (GlpM family)